MALNAYMTLTATRQGAIEGSVTQQAREGSIEVFAVAHAIVAPRDPASGRPKGKRMHKPFNVIKPVDRSSPKLHLVLTQNENLSDVTLRFFRPAENGTEKLAYVVRLQNATIASLTTRQYNTKNARLAPFPLVEEVSFVYQRIQWTWVDGAVFAEDDWEFARVV
jgi:type VI secretion system secreted protein Hcp